VYGSASWSWFAVWRDDENNEMSDGTLHFAKEASF